MRNYLVVAHKTLVGPHLLAEIRHRYRLSERASRFHLLVPMTPPTEGDHSHGQVAEFAGERLAAGLVAVRELGVPATGEIGDAHPVTAVQDLLRRGEVRVDEIIVSTLPPGISAWLRLDVPHRLANAVDVPVHHVVPAREAVA
jgi:hypothetical protein